MTSIQTHHTYSLVLLIFRSESLEDVIDGLNDYENIV